VACPFAAAVTIIFQQNANTFTFISQMPIPDEFSSSLQVLHFVRLQVELLT